MKNYTELATDLTNGVIHPENSPERKVQVQILHQRLLAPFPGKEMDVRPGSMSSGKAQPLYYVDPRAYAKRLDQVLGLDGYSIRTATVQLAPESLAEMGWNATTSKRERTGDKNGLLVAMAVELEIHHPLLNKTVSNVGEKSVVDQTADNKVTSSYAQAYKRAATHLGVAAFLYFIDMPNQPIANNKFSGKLVPPPNDVMEAALKDVGFKGICEETGKKIAWNEAAISMHYFGRVLAEAVTRRLLEEESAD